MDRTIRMIRAILSNPWFRWFVAPAAVIVAAGTVMSQNTPQNTAPLVQLSPEPLYARGARAKPTLTLALSVEFPTVGAQYLGPTGGSVDNSYSASTQYPGYFDTESCYVYNDQPSEVPPGGTATADYKRFDWLGSASSTDPNHPRTCGGFGFSGNFMNWASSSAVDILRYGLTGGDRVIDTPTLTVLQRAVLPNTTVSNNFWNGSNFPDKQISNDQAKDALPAGLLGVYTGTLHIANCLNRIHFGTSATGSCDYPGDNSDLGTATPAAHGPITPYTGPLPPEFTTKCADENNVCTFSGIMRVAYGAGNSWYMTSATSPITCSNTVFGDPDVGTVKACYIAPDTTGWSPNPWNSVALTSDGFFYARVSVCGTYAGNLTDPRTSLCLRYPAGSYKPIGNMQRYSDRMSISVFGYLNDPTDNPNQRYGGVLRVPMKYVGPTSYDQNFQLVSGANPVQEWDPSTGVFFANPDNNTTVNSGPTYAGPPISGAINYLNQFGRTGVLGQYKTFDPVSELYYESLRYLQGLPPTPQAAAGVAVDGNGVPTGSSPLLDGFPITTNWVDPHPAVTNAGGTTDYSCFKNNIVTIGDIHTHNDASIPGTVVGSAGYVGGSNFLRTPNVANNEPDFNFWMKVVGGFESNNHVDYADGKGNPQTTGTGFLNTTPTNNLWGLENRAPYGDYDSYYMAGIAYWANTHDIRGADWSNTQAQRPGMRVTTFVLDVNEFGESSDYGNRHQNQFFLAGKYGGFNDVSGTGNPFNSGGTTGDNMDWSGTATGVEPTNYFLSSSASAVLAALDAIFQKVASQSYSIAGGAISTQTLSTVPGYVYQAQFDPAQWSGDLFAYQFVADSDGTITIGNSPTDSSAAWQASVALDSKASSTPVGGDARNIVVGAAGATASPTAMNFVWGSLDATTKNALLTPPYAVSGAQPDPDATGQARLSYLRGDRSNEAPNGLLFRTRGSVLGDIVNSGVVFEGAPTQSISDATYQTFYNQYLGRKHALFVGANDGMLHAFDPDHGFGNSDKGKLGGNELFAYIPSWVVPRLANLTSSKYVHQSYVDSTPAVAEAFVGDTKNGGVWKTVLVGGTGGGGQGVYALDVSDPAAFGPDKVMWEFTDADDADLGNVIGKPQILKLRTNKSTDATNYRYFAVVASGVNNYAADGHASPLGQPAIFLLDLAKPAGAKWVQGQNYFKLGGTQSSATDTFHIDGVSESGMAGFTARTGDDGALTQIYAGDLQGNLWKIDFTADPVVQNGTDGWRLSMLSPFVDGSGVPLPLYIAADVHGKRQPITMDPTIVYGANRTIIVTFGTGKFLEVSDLTNTDQQSVYAVLDDNTSVLDSGDTSQSAVLGRSRLVQGQDVYDSQTGKGTVTVAEFNWGRSMSDTASPVRSGWYFDFPVSGERQISDFALPAGLITFGSLIPPVSSCDNGSGNLYTLSVLTGDGSSITSSVGIEGEPLTLSATVVKSSDSTGGSNSTTTTQTIQQGAGGVVGGSPSTLSVTSGLQGRLSWREVTNYQCVKNSPIGICP